MPPIGTDRESRLILFDLAPILPALRREGTTFIPHSARIERSKNYGFWDEPYIEAIHVTSKSCPPASEVPNFLTPDKSRAQVSYEIDPALTDCPKPTPTEGITLVNTNEACGRTLVDGETVSGLTFEPRCLAVVVAPGSRKALFDEMLAAGRIMTDDLTVSFNYTVGLHPFTAGEDEERLIENAATNCAHSMLMMDNYARDKILQDELDELERVRDEISTYEKLIKWFDRLMGSRRLMLPPNPPPPPPPPPVPEVGGTSPRAPPAPPKQVTFEEFRAQYEGEIRTRENRVLELLEEIDGCVGTRTGRACGLPSNEAPDPWLALNLTTGEATVPCRGYGGRQTREQDYCGYWSAGVNPNAADNKLKKELLRVGPHCMAADDRTVLQCSPNATRTQRAGVYELQYLVREDRSYCESEFFREAMTPDAVNASQCRQTLREHNESCYLECDTCGATCSSPATKALVSTYACSVGLPTFGLQAAFEASDIAVDISGRWGAIREKGRPPTPEDAFQEQYHTMVQNDIHHPVAPRNALSCRKSHFEATTGAYVPPLHEDGYTIKREGFLVPCTTDSDCMSRCGTHPILGSPYVCTHGLRLYTYARIDEKTGEYSTIDEPGDDEFDPKNRTSEPGLCTDVQ